jgi:hypothetical protein
VVSRSQLHADRLAYHVFRPRGRDASGVAPAIREAAYEHWHDVWSRTLFELDGAECTYSDDFTRQDEVGALFHGDEFVGLTAHRRVDLRVRADREDSYFRAWPAEAVDAAIRLGPVVCIGSHLTVTPVFRHATPYSVKHLLLALAIERFLASDAMAMVGTLRVDRGMHTAGAILGFRPLASRVVHHGVDVELVALSRTAGPRVSLEPESEGVVRSLCRQGDSRA